MATKDADAEFAAIAEELYALPPGGFTAERNARAKAARADGDRDLGARIAALPKASAAAWLLNLLAREGADDLDRVLELGDELRHAQQQSDRDRLRRLTTQRRELLAEVARRTADRAEQAGQRTSAAVLEEFQQTLQAALVDDDVAAAVRTGRLTRAVTADGLDPADLTDAIGGPGRIAPPRPRATAKPAPKPADEPDEDPKAAAERARRRQQAEQRAADAERRAVDARHAAKEAGGRAAEAEDEAGEHEQAAERLRADLDALRRRLEEAETALADAQHDAAEARTAADRADRAAADARSEADEASARLRDLAD